MRFTKGFTPWNKGLVVKTKHICLVCGKEFIRNFKKAKYCSFTCVAKANTGIKRSMETRNKLRISHLGKTLPDEQKRKIGIRSLGHTLSEEARQRISIKNSGSNCGSWKGGISPIRDLIRSLACSKQWIKEVLTRDNFTCKLCGGQSSKGKFSLMHAHHKTEFSKLLKDFLNKYNEFSPIEDKFLLKKIAERYQPFWDINNGITLCKKCHKETHAKQREQISNA